MKTIVILNFQSRPVELESKKVPKAYPLLNVYKIVFGTIPILVIRISHKKFVYLHNRLRNYLNSIEKL